MITVKLVGFDRLERGLREMKGAIKRDELRDKMIEVLRPIEQDIETNAPRRTKGRIAAATVVAEIEPQPGETVRVAVGPGRKGFILRFFEFGTSKMPARPVLRPAWGAYGPQALQQLRTWVGDQLRASAVAAGLKVDR